MDAMKYKASMEIIPQSQRMEINQKILFLIDDGETDRNNITQNDVYNSYTGVGGLHGLSRKDYNNYYEYSKDKKSVDNGQYFTTPPFADFLMRCVSPDKHDIIMDLTGGAGAFINFCPVEQNFYMNEIDANAVKVAEYLYPDAHITCGDIILYEPETKADLIVGNPPYNLKWQAGDTEYLSQLYYCVKAAALLKPGGLLALIVPSSFMANEFIDASMIREIDLYFNFICQFDIPADAFKSMGVSSFQTKMVFFQKKSKHIKDTPYKTEKIELDAFTETQALEIHDKHIKPALAIAGSLRGKIYFEILQGDDNIAADKFNYLVRKLLYQIKVHPKTSAKYTACVGYVEKYRTQKPPPDMKYSEWRKICITPAKVIAYLEKAIAEQNKRPEQEIIRLVKNKYEIKLKGYSHKTRAFLKETCSVKVKSINDLVLYDKYPFADPQFKNLIKRKRQAFVQQKLDYSSMVPDEKILNYVNNLVIYDRLNEEIIRLNPIQASDTAKLLSKQYGFLQWEQGSGKTISGIAQYLYRRQHNNIFCTFVVSTAISIKNNWDEVLQFYGLDYIMINKLEDIDKIRRGQMVLITLNMLDTYQRFVKRFIKKHSQKVFLIYDESDASTSMDSKRSKAVKNCFRRVKYKTLMTGTSTRNNINEFYSQYELIFNNSINMLCECEVIYYRNSKNKEKAEILSSYNEDVGNPFPAYKKGYKLFQRCFLPEKITVFGVGQNTQDIYNADELKRILDCTIITRTFEEVTGKRIYKIKQETCVMSEAEKEIYKIAIDEFYKLEYLFNKTGNKRKDAMLKVLNQLKALLRVCAAPQTLNEYKSDSLPPKFERVLSIIENSRDERIAIGVRHHNVVNEYAKAIQKAYPDRPLFVVTGEKASLKKRRDIIRELENTSNGILLSTQQSLSCAINCDCVDTCVVPELFWNNAAMSQYYFRFIRYNSTRPKKVIFVTYEHSIESNLLLMIMCKEKLNLFMKNQTLEDEELNEKFGVDFDILRMLMAKVKDHEGKIRIRWGEQEIITSREELYV